MFAHLVDAIRLAYDSTPSTKVQDDPARKLLSQYVALRYTTLSDEKFDTLISEGKVMVDLSRKIVRGLAMSGRST